MKKFISVLAAVLIAACAYSQAPQKMSYQAVIRDQTNALIIEHGVGMRVSILQGSENGVEVYKEIYYPNPETNINGLVTIEIGAGLPLLGTFASINWAAGPYFIKTETDPTGGTNYSIIGTSQLLSVPYALFSGNTSSEPSGIIVMWSGTINSIPAGWALCDGTNGTPNLTDKFILSVSSAAENPGGTGGSNSYSLTVNQLPSHNHVGTAISAGEHNHATGTLNIADESEHTHGVGNLTIGNNGTHSHTGTTSSDGDHTHQYLKSVPSINISMSTGSNPFYDDYDNDDTDNAGEHDHSFTTNTSGNHTHNISGSTGNGESHNHDISGTTESTGDHTHTLTIEDTGNGSAIDNRPSFYKLAYIMKL